MAVEPFISSVASAIIGQIRTDVVAVYDQNYNRVFPDARFLKASISPNSKPMEHPIETGATITDHRIIEPTEIELPLLLTSGTYRNTYEQIAQIYNNATILNVQTRVGVFTNQFIISYPSEETPEFYDSIILNLKLKEVLFVQSIVQTVTPRNPNNVSTVNRGTINSQTPTPAQTTAGSSLYRKVPIRG